MYSRSDVSSCAGCQVGATEDIGVARFATIMRTGRHCEVSFKRLVGLHWRVSRFYFVLPGEVVPVMAPEMREGAGMEP